MDDEFDINKFYHGEEFARLDSENNDYANLSWKKDSIKLQIGFNSLGKNILILDDDDFISRDYQIALQVDFNKVWTVKSPEEFIKFIKTNRKYIDIIIVDIRMNHGELLGSIETRGGWSTGVVLAEIARDLASDSLIIALTLSQEALDKLWFENNQNCFFCNKRDYPPDKFLIFIKSITMKEYPKLRAFIVHGHDHQSLFELKNYLQNRLGWPEPIVLFEKASKGRTVIEKFEDYSDKIDIVFSLFTPDDFTGNDSDVKRARQNVVFEFGYFIGKLGRKSGKVFLLCKNMVELPTDLSGVIYIDISHGIEKAGETLRKEIESLWLAD